jgi:hypothetical protein
MDIAFKLYQPGVIDGLRDEWRGCSAGLAGLCRDAARGQEAEKRRQAENMRQNGFIPMERDLASHNSPEKTVEICLQMVETHGLPELSRGVLIGLSSNLENVIAFNEKKMSFNCHKTEIN